MTEKFVAYFRLIDVCGERGCPVCRCVEEDGRRYLHAVMYEQVNDPAMRHRLHASWGFCNPHTWMLLEIPNAKSGAAIIHEDLLRMLIRRLRRLKDRRPSGVASGVSRLLGRRRPAIVELSRRRNACPVCAWSVDAETGYLLSLLRFVDDPAFARAWAKSEGICVPHLLEAIELGAGTPGLRCLLDRTLATWETLRRDLDRFVGKHDYRNLEPFTDAEASSYERAFETLSGRRGLWGNARHLGAHGARRPEPSRAAADGDVDPAPDVFERRKLERRVTELTTQLSEAMSRGAALHYRLSRVAEDRDALELNLSGERGTNALAMQTIDELRSDNQRLRAELAAAHREGVGKPSTG